MEIDTFYGMRAKGSKRERRETCMGFTNKSERAACRFSSLVTCVVDGVASCQLKFLLS